MCDATADFTTITGPRAAIEWLMMHWEGLELSTGKHLWEVGIQLHWNDLAVLGEQYAASDCGAVAVAHHSSGDGARVAATLSAVLLTLNRHDLPDGADPRSLLSETGHTYVADGVSGAAPNGPLLDAKQVQLAKALVPGLPKRPGSRVALLDTGDAASRGSMLDLTSGVPVPDLPAEDPHGHGTAVAEAIRAMAPHADVLPVRVLDASCEGSSIAIFQGLIAALWDAQQCDVVNASLSVEARATCGTVLGATFEYLMMLRWSQQHKGPQPELVVAAGNNLTEIRAPATATGARVVTATSLSGATASYCADLHIAPHVNTVQAPGGEPGNSLGHYPSGHEIWGTSFAAGFISGALLG